MSEQKDSTGSNRDKIVGEVQVRISDFIDSNKKGGLQTSNNAEAWKRIDGSRGELKIAVEINLPSSGKRISSSSSSRDKESKADDTPFKSQFGEASAAMSVSATSDFDKEENREGMSEEIRRQANTLHDKEFPEAGERSLKSVLAKDGIRCPSGFGKNTIPYHTIPYHTVPCCTINSLFL